MLEDLLVFNSEHWVIADKPAGWLTVPGRLGSRASQTGQAPPCLGLELSQTVKSRLWPVHRLDREVSGLVLFAKTAQAHREANQWFEVRRVQKTYHALTEAPGLIPQGFKTSVSWNMKILRGKKRAYESPRGHEAITEARVLREEEKQGFKFLRWELSPHTGRPHQLRVVLLKYCNPIVGDVLYGAPETHGVLWGLTPPAIALRALKLGFAQISPDKRLGLPEKVEVHEGF